MFKRKAVNSHEELPRSLVAAGMFQTRRVYGTGNTFHSSTDSGRNPGIPQILARFQWIPAGIDRNRQESIQKTSPNKIVALNILLNQGI